jgi:hypothetical protein
MIFESPCKKWWKRNYRIMRRLNGISWKPKKYMKERELPLK